MKQRIIFSIAIHANPDILLLDEAFAVGDEQFRNKCSKIMSKLTQKGSTLLLVGHTLDIIEKQCSRVIWIDKGEIIIEGDSKKIIKKYKNYEGRSFH